MDEKKPLAFQKLFNVITFYSDSHGQLYEVYYSLEDALVTVTDFARTHTDNGNVNR